MKTSNSLLALVLSFILFIPGGCGGGTSGTGGSGSHIQGTLLTKASKAPIAGFKVTLKGTSDFDFTDDLGNFDVLSDTSLEEPIELLFEGNNSTVTVEVNNIPDGTEKIDLDLSFDELSNDIDIDDIDYIDVVDEDGDELDDQDFEDEIELCEDCDDGDDVQDEEEDLTEDEVNEEDVESDDDQTTDSEE